ncbi:hypothetical protein QR685DRAFT_435774, partial [Neurospora intermedia]
TSLYITFTDRTNRRLSNISIYLFRYKLKVFYISVKLNFVLDVFSRLKAIRDNSNPDRTAILDNI